MKDSGIEEDVRGDNAVTNLSIALGGPIYVSNMVSPLTSVPDFEYALLHDLKNLKTECCPDSLEQCGNDELSVDELKIHSDEELVEMAMQEVFKDGENNQEQLNAGREVDSSISRNKETCLGGLEREGGTSTCNEAFNGSHGTTSSGSAVSSKSGKINRKKNTKSGKRKRNTNEDEENNQEQLNTGGEIDCSISRNKETHLEMLEREGFTSTCIEAFNGSHGTTSNGSTVSSKSGKINRNKSPKSGKRKRNTNEDEKNSQEQSNTGGEVDFNISRNKETCLERLEREGGTSTSMVAFHGSYGITSTESAVSSKSGKIKGNKSTESWKRKRNTNDESYLVKVDEVLKIKQKQDEDKAAARLHSFDGSCKNIRSAIPSSERVERMKSLRSINSHNQIVRSSEIQEHIAVRHPEILLCIEVYHYKRKWLKTQEFLVLGRQTLTEMKDKIFCLTDQMMQKAGQHDPSGYFLVEDVFYNDLRDPLAIDYSEPICDWLSNSKDEALRKWEYILSGELQQKQKALLGEGKALHLPKFKRVEMQKTRFCDMKFRLGAGYLYCHQGDCKHSIVIRDMRLMHPEDVQNKAAYPISVFELKFRTQKCHVCKIYKATKKTVNDKWAGENPCYLCDDCYYLLHYSENGSLLYADFFVYDYLHEC